MLIYQIEYLTKQIRKQPLNQKTTQTLWYCSTTYDEDLPDIGHNPKHMQVITYSQHSEVYFGHCKPTQPSPSQFLANFNNEAEL